MPESSLPKPTLVGVAPWFPWPFSAWSWWTEPVRAERLAALRIGTALCLLTDVAYNYAPGLTDYFTKDSLGNPVVFNWQFYAPRMNWSLFRGVGDEVTMYLSLAIWIVTTCWIIGTTMSRLTLIHADPPVQDRTGIALVVATCAHAWYVAGVWSRMMVDRQANLAGRQPDELAWLIPLAGSGLALLYLAMELATRLRDPSHRIGWASLTFALSSSAGLVAAGFALANRETDDPDAWWLCVLRSWQETDSLIFVAMALWIAFAVLLLVGCWTRGAAILAWMLSMSFANLNSSLDNAGDTIRLILLFYLMLCPCGAVWSVDAWLRKRSGPVYVHPWPMRLLFLQMIPIYFMNGVYKLFGPVWLQGDSLHFVLGDVVLTRFSVTWLSLPIWLTRTMSWTVLAWELLFPLLIMWKWTRILALFFGVMFHLGIFATMELAGFVPYALCMYLPLLPWERLGKQNNPQTEN